MKLQALKMLYDCGSTGSPTSEKSIDFSIPSPDSNSPPRQPSSQLPRSKPRQRVSFRNSSSNSKTFDPNSVLLMKDTTEKDAETNKRRRFTRVDDVSSHLDTILDKSQNVQKSMQELVNATRQTQCQYSISKDNNKYSVKSRKANTALAEYSIPFDAYKVVPVVFPNNHAKNGLLTMSSPSSGPQRAQCFVVRDQEYCWRKTRYGMKLTKDVSTCGVETSICCAKYVRGGRKGEGLLVVDGDKVDKRIVVVTVGVCLRREETVRAKFEGVLRKCCIGKGELEEDVLR